MMRVKINNFNFNYSFNYTVVYLCLNHGGIPPPSRDTWPLFDVVFNLA